MHSALILINFTLLVIHVESHPPVILLCRSVKICASVWATSEEHEAVLFKPGHQLTDIFQNACQDHIKSLSVTLAKAANELKSWCVSQLANKLENCKQMNIPSTGSRNKCVTAMQHLPEELKLVEQKLKGNNENLKLARDGITAVVKAMISLRGIAQKSTKIFWCK